MIRRFGDSGLLWNWHAGRDPRTYQNQFDELATTSVESYSRSLAPYSGPHDAPRHGHHLRCNDAPRHNDVAQAELRPAPSLTIDVDENRKVVGIGILESGAQGPFENSKVSWSSDDFFNIHEHDANNGAVKSGARGPLRALKLQIAGAVRRLGVTDTCINCGPQLMHVALASLSSRSRRLSNRRIEGPQVERGPGLPGARLRFTGTLVAGVSINSSDLGLGAEIVVLRIRKHVRTAEIAITDLLESTTAPLICSSKSNSGRRRAKRARTVTLK